MKKDERVLCEYSDGITCEIPLKMPSLNEYIRACRSNAYAGAKMKAEVERNISWFLKDLPHFDNPVKIAFHWQEANKRRDFDNICASKKFILDALVTAGGLTDDNRRHVVGFTDTFSYGDEYKVTLTIKEV